MYDSPILIVIVFSIIIIIFSIFWLRSGSNSSLDSTLSSDVLLINQLMSNDSHLHRLLMIEIVTDSPNLSPVLPDVKHSNEVTFNKMSTGMVLLGKTLIRGFGVTISERIATLLNKRNQILKEYYKALNQMICENGECVLTINKDENGKKVNNHVFPPAFLTPQEKYVLGSDITTLTERKLESITREITDQVSISFHIRDVDQTTTNNRPILHFQRLFNLIRMYDKELINQAKSYASKHYDISMNCAQSALEITRHITDELGIVMKDNHGRIRSLS